YRWRWGRAPALPHCLVASPPAWPACGGSHLSGSLSRATSGGMPHLWQPKVGVRGTRSHATASPCTTHVSPWCSHNLSTSNDIEDFLGMVSWDERGWHALCPREGTGSGRRERAPAPATLAAREGDLILSPHKENAMHRRQSLMLTIVGLMFLLGGTLNWANNPTNSHAQGTTAGGTTALDSLTTGSGNTAFGKNALTNDPTGSRNTATGDAALRSTTTGNDNTATGFGALFANTTGSENTAC